MSGLDYIGLAFLAFYVTLLVYAFRHRTKPFWGWFLDPFGLFTRRHP